ncbi:helix-turn-helix domain-containing protein [Sphingomonas sp. CFBP8993]|uniref:helix-turn-helix domain-containing protein n=1 Tax=Sphingomonas sp. CFBP8993 TaxID=3096526 RepID=UPI002A6B370F|nr:helix-turn-helix domain-containing protein [Sphingomonas sp. CFBP8993]MDY0957145.1 helix-turn-helix domain-containing protein [Sphingomonas sp. CFBP8993]
MRAAVECAPALAILGAAGTIVTSADLAFAVGDAPLPVGSVATIAPQSLEEEIAALERRRIVEALQRTGHNHTHTTRGLGLSRVGLLKKMDRMGLR